MEVVVVARRRRRRKSGEINKSLAGVCKLFVGNGEI